MEDLTGKQLGPYQVVAPLGEGGMAAVYKAYQPSMERYVALKILPRHLASDPNFVGRFRQESRVLAKLQHTNILPVHDFGEADGYTYIVMPFVETGTLTDLLKGQPLPLPQIRRLISQIGEALNYAHARGLIHRDVKPGNVLIDESGNCLLTDFGIAKMVEGAVKFTTTGGIVGTPAYMSPEQGRGEKLDARSDIYSLGVMLYEMATGRIPFEADTPIAIVFKHINDPLPLPRSLNPDLPEAVELVILKALAKQPEERFQKAGDMVRALERAIPEAAPAVEAVVTPATTLPAKPARTIKRSDAAAPTLPEAAPAARPKWLPVVAGVVVMSLLSGIGWGLFGGGELAARGGGGWSSLQRYDDFNNPAYEGIFNQQLWDLNGAEGVTIAQKNGILNMAADATGQSEGIFGSLTVIGGRPLSEANAVEAKLALAEAHSGSQFAIGLRAELAADPTQRRYTCWLEHGAAGAFFRWSVLQQGEAIYESGQVEIEAGRAHTVRIEVNAAAAAMRCYLDGEQIDTYQPPGAASLANEEFLFSIVAWAAGDSSGSGTVDNFALGASGGPTATPTTAGAP